LPETVEQPFLAIFGVDGNFSNIYPTNSEQTVMRQVSQLRADRTNDKPTESACALQLHYAPYQCRCCCCYA